MIAQAIIKVQGLPKNILLLGGQNVPPVIILNLILKPPIEGGGGKG